MDAYLGPLGPARDRNADNEIQWLTDQLTYIHKRLQKNPGLARQVPFLVRQRGKGDRKKFAKIAQYTGTDQNTLYLLQTEAETWHHQPALFWNRQRLLGLPGFHPHIDLVSRYLHLAHDDA